MKLIPFSLFSTIILFSSCQNSETAKSGSTIASAPRQTINDTTDNRPKEQIYFLNRVKAESDYDVTSNAMKKDEHIKAFNKYAIDSLKKVTSWEMIVTDVNDNKVATNSFAKNFFDLVNNPVYNIDLVSPIKVDKSVDTIAIDNRVDFIYTIPKTPKGDSLKKQLAIIRTLSKGDVVIVSGSLTHLDDNGKIDFSSLYDTTPWEVDLLLTSIRKK